jgi:hypothetical protein
MCTSALCQPKDMRLVAGLDATHSEKSEIMNEAKSVSKCAASVAIARLFAITPPTLGTGSVSLIKTFTCLEGCEGCPVHQGSKTPR